MRACLAWGVALTAANLVLAFVTPDELPALVVWLPFMLATRLMAKHWLGPELDAHAAAGGQDGSWGVAVLAGVIGMVVSIGVIFGLVVLTEGF